MSFKSPAGVSGWGFQDYPRWLLWLPNVLANGELQLTLWTWLTGGPEGWSMSDDPQNLFKEYWEQEMEDRWKVYRYVQRMLRLFYKSDETVKHDSELQAWCRDH
ncbi:Arachidonate 12-lipoxygenase, epidermal-type [Sciurus carolinensis]|uniref:Arachidonate 12-lipoxygenase, epidermal-type n=1 Tax=Sciurus carolinensis TaxID=30640 RepID=A0AA41MEA2_SCICA|nr:Arachidonate 12-lipoxygenase, epidermal-type [Sciurus carolinensis]